jgi:hypothetical protein
MPLYATVGIVDRRFWMRVERNGECWDYTGAPSMRYPTIKRGGVAVPAYKYLWGLIRGPLPDGFVLDHLCRRTRCVRPLHLEPVTPAENTARSNRIRGTAVTHCPRGHEYTEENTRRQFNPRTGWWGRWCRTCDREKKRTQRRIT